MLHKHSDSSYLESISSSSSELSTASEPPRWWQRAAGWIKIGWEEVYSKTDRELLEIAHGLAHSLPKDIHAHSSEDHQTLIWFLDRFTEVARRKLEKLEGDLERLKIDAMHILILCNLGSAIIRGLLVNKILDWQSFNDLDRRDFSTWLSDNGAWTQTVTPFPPEDFVFGGGQGMRSRWWPAHQRELSNHTQINGKN